VPEGVRRRAHAASALVAVLLAASLPACSSGSGHHSTAPTTPPTTISPFGPSPAGWLLSTTDSSLGGAPTWVGNGYLATRVPAQGTGYRTTPVETQSQVAGFYAHPPGMTEQRVSVATWSTFGFSDGSGNFGNIPGPGGGVWSDYRQTLDLRTGMLSTSVNWTSPAGHATRLQFVVLTDRARPHLAVVRMTVTPSWSGNATITDMIDGAGARNTTSSVVGNAAAQTLQDTLVANGTHTTATIFSALSPPAHARALPAVPGSVAQTIPLPVVSGRTYTFTKYVGIATSVDTDRDAAAVMPPVDAHDTALAGVKLGWENITKENAAAWATLWQSDITVDGNPTLTMEARAALFYLLASARAGVNWSVSPSGLAANDYSGHVFWDAETWMYPPLLALHPDIAQGIDTYRQKRLAAAAQYAKASHYAGARFPWESAASGTEQAPAPWGPFEQHITADIALAQWQYYEATGDLTWLKTQAWPVIKAAADFWTSRVVRDPRGGYSIAHVMGPDEFHSDVTNSAYTNTAAVGTLRIAARAAALVGVAPDARWAPIAAGIRIAVNPLLQLHPEFDGYLGDQIKQADVVMMQYPWNAAIARTVAQNDLDYYVRLVAPNGPSMTESIHMIDTAAANTPGCSAQTFLQRSIDPYERGPFDQISETPGAGALSFVTGAGGVLQEFLFGFTGLRWAEDAVVLDPMLPPQMTGLHLTGLQWHGSHFDIAIAPFATTITLTAGPDLPVRINGTVQTVTSAAPLAVSTRRPDLTATTDLARCHTVTANAASPGFPALAAVDGETSTAWHATTPDATLTVDLGTPVKLRQIVVHSEHKQNQFSLDVSLDGKNWVTVATRRTRNSADITTPTTAIARYVRYRVTPGAIASIRELVVRP
jgi:trehalose/maltose hydrolase-like predicted phosphorylase